ncbi:hypothetical protein BBJ28_00008624 [Nothophytophthora sp. Chile5]|nr:hypothetical protein BBJ28_00008624 [Nothophytophthora sp. Chile5]
MELRPAVDNCEDAEDPNAFDDSTGVWENTEWGFHSDDSDDSDDEGLGALNDGDEGEETQHPMAATRSEARTYVDALKTNSGLQLMKEGQIRNAYQEKGEYGLFSLFATEGFKRAVLVWTNEILESRGDSKISAGELNAYVGLELAMSICAISDISEFWSERRFLRQADFGDTMARSRFQAIRSGLKLHPPDQAAGAQRGQDPLWHSRWLLEHFQKKFTELAVPVGVSSLDECTVRTKARTGAKSYLPSKPDKYGIRFYAIVGWTSLYVHSLWDNGSGNSSPTSASQRYCELYPSMRTPLRRTLAHPEVDITSSEAKALWLAMMGHQTLQLQDPNGRRLIVSDNYYTRHILARALLVLTDGEVRTIGTCRMNYVDRWNKPSVVEAVQSMKGKPRGSWTLVAAVDAEPDWVRKEVAHKKKQKDKPASQRAEYDAHLTISPHAGYVVFNDNKVVVIYTNDLRSTPSSCTIAARSLDQDSVEAARCCHGLHTLRRWVDGDMMHRSTFNVPAVIVAYNQAMNAVDRVDQLRSTNPTRRKEKRLTMSLFTWLLDLAVINAFALLREVNYEHWRNLTLREFKRRIAEEMTASELRAREDKRRRERSKRKQPICEVVGADSSLHIITPNSRLHSKGKLRCYLCSIRGLGKKALYGCTQCNRGFHIECFSVFHFRHAFRSNSTAVQRALDAVSAAASQNPEFKTRCRPNQSITPIEELTLPE